MLKRTPIIIRLSFGFAFVLLCMLLLGGVATNSITRLSEVSSKIFKHPITVTSAILKVRSEVLVVDRVMAEMVHAASPESIKQFTEKRNEQKVLLEDNIATVRKHYLGNPDDIIRIDQALNAWQKTSEEILSLIQQGRNADAKALHNGHYKDSSLKLLYEVDHIAAYAHQKASDFKQKAEQDSADAGLSILHILALAMLTGSMTAIYITLSIQGSMRQVSHFIGSLLETTSQKADIAEAIAAGDLSRDITRSGKLTVDLNTLPNDEVGELMKSAITLSETRAALDEAFLHMTAVLRDARKTDLINDWFKTGQGELNSLMRGDQKTAEMANRILAYLAEYLHANIGALYLIEEESEELKLIASYAFSRPEDIKERFKLGEGLIGQAARERKLLSLTNVPQDYISITSALGESVPKMLIAFPLIHGDRLVGAIELGSLRHFNDDELEFIRTSSEDIAIEFNTNLAHQRMAVLLEKTQQQTEELRVQQEELQQSNEELEERAQMLEQQRELIRLKNQEIEKNSEEIQQKAEEMERISTYKSEFLANMSHELRTPLNSLMILSSLLMQNKEDNLTEKQVNFATTINGAGRDLLNLINDILDFSKVEAGQMQFNFAELPMASLRDSLRATFDPLADEKGLSFSVNAAENLPPAFMADEQRVHQILRNLLSNAIKFTSSGEVTCNIYLPDNTENPLSAPALALAVTDTGIGIPPDKQQLVFEAFQQVDGAVSRKYGGTGLGLSISQQLAHGMQGHIHLQSEEGKGSTFTLYLPLQQSPDHAFEPQIIPAPKPTPKPAPKMPAQAPTTLPEAWIADDRERLQPDERSILVIEDDRHFCGLLVEHVHEKGFSALAAKDGRTGITLAEQFLPSAIILDVKLPDIDGWSVMHSLKSNPNTRHIPVHFITGVEEEHKALSMGAIGYATKPLSSEQLCDAFQTIGNAINQTVKHLLIVEDNPAEAMSMEALLEAQDVEITLAESGEAAIKHLEENRFDCMVLDLGLSGMSGFELLERIQAMEAVRRIPVIIHSGRELTREEEKKLRHFAESIIVKGALSPERLLNEVSLFLHLVESNLHPSKQRMIRASTDKEAMLEGQKILLVDDDMRNVFSLTSALVEKNMTVIEAEDGNVALTRLEEHPDISLVLMDIMMPEMDGYTAMREIRKNPRTAKVPIIAMTAKALQDDRDKCLAAGANDYISKPIEIGQLLSLISVWLYQEN